MIELKLNGKQISRTDKFTPPFLIAEIGVNYYDIAVERDISIKDAAKLMIKEAIFAGVDAVKFQTYKAEFLTSIYSPAYWDTSKESTTNQYELFKKYDHFEFDDYLELMDYTKSLGGIFLTTLFDEFGIEKIGKYLPAHKIASADITNYPLLKSIANFHKPTMISVGASTITEIWNAINILTNEGLSYEDIAVFHCVLKYPTPPEFSNLYRIKLLRQYLPEEITIGYSDHVPPDDSLLTLTTASLLGAKIIEKHFTLNKNLEGNDHYHAFDPEDIRNFRKKIRFIEKLISKDEINYLKGEESARLNARRSLVARSEIEKGELLTNDNIIIKRPGSGISPIYWESIIKNRGKSKRIIKKDEIIQWTDLTF